MEANLYCEFRFVKRDNEKICMENGILSGKIMEKTPSQVRKNFVFELLRPEMLALREKLLERSWTIVEAPYMVFKASSEKVSVAAYESGKLVVQGANAQDFVEFILEPEILKEKAFEGAMERNIETPAPFSPHAGMDESGKGDFFGPLVVACVFVADEESARKLAEIGVRDSKLIKNDKIILRIASEIRKIVNGKFSIVAIGPEAYNSFYEKIQSLNRLLAWGHARALENLLEKAPECTAALADKFGDESLIRNALLKAGRSIRLDQRTKAESDIAVGAASILARAEFVRRMTELGEKHGVLLPKGAGEQVDRVAAQLALAGGATLLRQVAKMHFRNSFKALGLPMPEKTPWHKPS